MSDKYLVLPSTEVGIGHLLSVVLHCAYYAYKTDRTLALDMRRFHYAKTDRHARFLEDFGWEFPASLEVITDLDRIDRLTAGRDVHVLQSNERLIVAQPFDHDVLIVPCTAPGQPYQIGLKRADVPFRITLKGRLQEAWEELAQAPEWRRGVVGMHFRRMSGEILERINPTLIPDYEERYQSIRDQYIEKAQAVARQAGMEDPAFFVASEDRNFVSYVKERLPGAFSAGEQLPAAPDQSWQANVAARGFDHKVLVDAINDLWSLSFCDYLVHSPHSGYSLFALMNSPKLDLTKRHIIEIPTCEELFDSLPPATAVEWTRAAVRKTDAHRVEEGFPHRWLAKALERAGELAEAALERQRTAWHTEARSSAVTVPGEQIDWVEVAHGQYGRAIAIARRVAERLPGNPFVLAGYRQSLSNLLAQAKNMDEATSWARAAIELDPGDPYLRAHLGDLLTRQKAFDEAERELRTAIEVEAGYPGFHDGLARCLAGQGRVDEAIAALRQAMSIQPDSIKWLERLNEVLLASGRAAEAEAVTRDAMLQRPDKASLHQALALILEHRGRVDEALAEAQRAIELEPGQTRWSSWLGEMLLRAGRFADAETVLEKAVAQDSESAHLHHVLSIAFERQNKIEEAASAARRAANLNPLQPTRRLRVSELLFRAGKYEEAEAAVRDAMSLHQADAGEYQLLSAVLERQARLDEASLAALTAAEIEPEQFTRHARAGDLLFRAGRWEEAESSLKRAIELCGDHVNSYHLLSIVLERQDRAEEALVPARRAAEMEPGPFRDARVGELLMRTGRIDEAETTLRQVIRRQQSVAMFHHLLSVILERRGRIEEAVSEAQLASELEPARDAWRDRLAALSRYTEAERAERHEAEEAALSELAEPAYTTSVGGVGTAEAATKEPPTSLGASYGGIIRQGFWPRRGRR